MATPWLALLPTQLGGVSVAIGGQPAYVSYISPTQINTLAPDYLAETVSVEVDTPDGRSNVVTVQRMKFLELLGKCHVSPIQATPEATRSLLQENRKPVDDVRVHRRRSLLIKDQRRVKLLALRIEASARKSHRLSIRRLRTKPCS